MVLVHILGAVPRQEKYNTRADISLAFGNGPIRDGSIIVIPSEVEFN